MNILGYPFDSFVKKQVEIRQEALGKYKNIDPSVLQYYSTKSPFIRLASSVNLTYNRFGSSTPTVPNNPLLNQTFQPSIPENRILYSNNNLNNNPNYGFMNNGGNDQKLSVLEKL